MSLHLPLIKKLNVCTTFSFKTNVIFQGILLKAKKVEKFFDGIICILQVTQSQENEICIQPFYVLPKFVKNETSNFLNLKCYIKYFKFYK